MILLDTNILVYASDETAPWHLESVNAVERAGNGELPGVLVPQVLMEFYAAITSSRNGSSALSAQDAWEQVENFRQAMPVLNLDPKALDELAVIVEEDRPQGRSVYDAFLVAQMRVYGVKDICTLNTKDFRYPGVTTHLPKDI